MSRLAALLLILPGVLLPALALGSPEPPVFSADANVGGLPSGWLPFNPSAKARPTRYALVRDGNTLVVRADADASMSGLIHQLRIDPAETPIIQWRWRIERPLKTADMTTKAGDDYAARLYVLFDYDVAKLSFLTRTRLKLAKTLYDVEVPAAALNYVWDNRQPVGTIRANAYTDRARMVVLESGADRAGAWVTETRDLAADFRAAFGEEAPAVTGIAIATDTDNTGERVTAWYGDIRFLKRGSP
ncbi:MAG: DUF3047 domain-containing protein [Gallionellaceae bacterium]|nr:DUF3047 domain-containing protein [Gallionellaceae bacterium]